MNCFKFSFNRDYDTDYLLEIDGISSKRSKRYYLLYQQLISKEYVLKKIYSIGTLIEFLDKNQIDTQEVDSPEEIEKVMLILFNLLKEHSQKYSDKTNNYVNDYDKNQDKFMNYKIKKDNYIDNKIQKGSYIDNKIIFNSNIDSLDFKLLIDGYDEFIKKRKTK